VTRKSTTAPVPEIKEEELEGDEGLVEEAAVALAPGDGNDVNGGGGEKGQGHEKHQEDGHARGAKAPEEGEEGHVLLVMVVVMMVVVVGGVSNRSLTGGGKRKDTCLALVLAAAAVIELLPALPSLGHQQQRGRV